MQSVDPGIRSESVCFPFTPSQAARELLFYPTWCGHYYCTANYSMKRDSYPPLLIAYIRKGCFRVEYRGEFHVAEAGDVLLLDCIEPHYYHAEDGLEFVYMHFEGSNARELCRRITDRHGWLIRRDTNTLIGPLLYDMVRFYDENGVETDMQRSARITACLTCCSRQCRRAVSGYAGRASHPVHSLAYRQPISVSWRPCA
ncbi:MAG: AraC family ligand binding domain-containing protein [Butyricicoccus sp.]